MLEERVQSPDKGMPFFFFSACNIFCDYLFIMQAPSHL